MPLMRTFQTMRNTMQAGRINIVSQARGAVSGMRPGFLGLEGEGTSGAPAGNNVTPPPEDGIKGPLGFWTFPLLNKVMGGEGVGGGGFGGLYKPSTKTAGLGVPSRVASRAATQGVATSEPSRAMGIHAY